MIKFLVSGQQLKIVTPIVVADTHNYQTAAAVFRGTEWEPCSKWAHFIKDAETYDVPFHSDEITADQSLDLTAGTWQVYIHGNAYDADTDTVITRITTNTAYLKVESAETDSPFPSVTPSFAETLAAEIENALQVASGVRQDAASGAFNGATFKPTVSSSGDLSWTNDKGMPNPDTVNIKGLKGDPGVKGDPGSDGYSPVASVEYVSGGVKITVTDLSGTKSAILLNGVDGKDGENGPQGIQGPQGIKGDKGEKGDNGTSFHISGYYPSLSELQSAVSSPSPGDAYGVGATAPYNIYIYDSNTKMWVDNGTIQGPQGIQGPKGDTGAQGPQGIQGEKGVKGDSGYSPTVSIARVDSGVNISVQNQSGVSEATVYDGTSGANGETGATFTPSLSASGDLSWTNDKGLPNPETVNIKGPKGDKPVKGDDYWTAEDIKSIGESITPSMIGAVADPTQKSDGQVLGYDGETGKWVAVNMTSGVSSVDGKSGNVVTRLMFVNQTIAANAFTLQSSPKYAGFPYVASKALSGVTAAMAPIVVFSASDATSGNFCPVVDPYSGGVYIYAHSAPSSAITIPFILCMDGEGTLSGMSNSNGVFPGSVTRAKLANDALYSPLVQKTGSYTLAAKDIGKTILSDGSSASDVRVITLNAINNDVLPIGAEFAIMAGNTGTTKLTVEAGIGVRGNIAGDVLASDGITVTIPRYCMIALKKFYAKHWFITGVFEVEA